MSLIKSIVRYSLILGIGFACAVPLLRALAADADTSIPSVLQAGFVFLPKNQAELTVDTWRKGGVLEAGGQSRLAASTEYLKEAQRVLGNYKSYELVLTKGIGKSSKIVYLSINYERGAVFARFLVYRTEKDWEVQIMNFNERQESI